jgi:hypothetical protein
VKDRNKPWAVKILALGFMLTGIPVLLISVAISLLALAVGADDPMGGKRTPSDTGQAMILVGVFNEMHRLILFVGSVGVLLGLLPTLSSIGLYRMQRWGLHLGYVTVFAWAITPLILMASLHATLYFYAIIAIITLLPAIALGRCLHRLRRYFNRYTDR